jgi:hypothetical protein
LLVLRRLTRRTGAADRKSGVALGHGDHWRCVFQEPGDGRLVAAIREAVDRPAVARSADGIAEYRLQGYAMSVAVLVRGKQVLTAYPAVAGIGPWSVTLTQIHPSPGGAEGRLTGTCMGAPITFFDTAFYKNRGRYRIGEAYGFNMGALSYSLGPASGLEAEMEGGVKLSLAGASAYMPASGLAGAHIDDYWFHSPVEGVVTSAEIAGVGLRMYPVTLGLPRDFPLHVRLCAAPHVEAPGSSELAPGDDVQGYLWLQGSLAHGDERK